MEEMQDHLPFLSLCPVLVWPLGSFYLGSFCSNLGI